MRSANEIEVVFVQEFVDDLGAERERYAPVVLRPALFASFRIGPEQIAKEPLVGHVRRPHDPPDLVHRLQVGTETAVATENLIAHDGGHGHAIETAGEYFPKLYVVPAFAFVVKSVYSVYAGALVIAAQQEEILGIFDFVRQQQAYGFQRLFAAVHVIAQEQVVGLGRVAAELEQPQQVVVLAVDVAAYFQRRLEFQERGLRQEHVHRHQAQGADFVLGQLRRAALLAAVAAGPNFQQSRYDVVDVQLVHAAHIRTDTADHVRFFADILP